MKRIFSLLLATVMIVSLAACTGTGSNPTSTPTKRTASGQLIVGSTTEPDGDFLAGWSANAVNQGVRAMIHGYQTVAYSPEGYVIDPVVVKNTDISIDDAGNKTYTFTLNENLTWNEGTKITAKDYVFDMMFVYSKEFKALEPSVAGGDNYIGYEEYFAGTTRTFAGIRLLGDYQFSVTIKADKLPYYFDLTYAQIEPAPMFLIAPGVDITDDGNGVTISDNFTADLLRQTLLDETTGYRYTASVSCGPYQLEKYDAAEKSITITVNPNFNGTYDGYTGQIEKIIFKYTPQATMIDALRTGDVDLLTGVGGGERINGGLDIVDSGKASYATYKRAGYGKIAFHCDWGPTQFVAVRQAIAYALDREEFCRQFTGGYGIIVHGYYGASQWEYQNNKEFLDSTLNTYAYNLDKAKQTLIDDGWTLNSKGGNFVEGVDEVRYKMVNGELMGLIINWACTDANTVSDMIATFLVPEAAKVGIKIVQNSMDFPTLSTHYYRNGVEKTYNMFNLATGFNPVSAPWYYYSMDPAYFGTYNSSFLTDQELADIANELKLTDPQDKDGWAAKWVNMQVRWNYMLPDIPLYSDEYYEFFNPKLENYTPDALWQWRYALIRANVK